DGTRRYSDQRGYLRQEAINPRRAILDRSGRPTRYRIAHENIVELISQSCDNVAAARGSGAWPPPPFQLRRSRADAFVKDADRNAAAGGWALRSACPSGISMTQALASYLRRRKRRRVSGHPTRQHPAR